MTSVLDPNEVRLTGENSFIRLAEQDGSEFTTRTSHWRVLYSPAGPGHALFVQSDLTDGHVAAYSDNIALARWLQEEIEAMIYPPFSDTGVQVVEADFERAGDARSFITERVLHTGGEILLTWYDLTEPFVMHMPPGYAGRTHGVYTVFFPAKRAQVTLNGQLASGRPLPVDREGRESTSACLAWSETWVKPRSP